MGREGKEIGEKTWREGKINEDWGKNMNKQGSWIEMNIGERTWKDEEKKMKIEESK